MLNLTKPSRLRPGDTVATVSLSWGGAGDQALLWRYELGKRRLQERFGLRVVEMPHTLAGTQYIYEHPEARAQDLMQAFADPEIRGIISCIGGDDSVRMLPYIDFEVIRRNPKVFLGYSDSTITHLMCLKAGFSSFYGPSILAEFAENVEIFPYTDRAVRRALFDGNPIGEIEPAAEWTGERLLWTKKNRHVRKTLTPNTGYEVARGTGKVCGPLIGGCIDVLEMAKGTTLWPESAAFDGAMLFLETSEDMPPPPYITYWLRNYGSLGILQRVRGLLFGKPFRERFSAEYKQAVLKVLDELGLTALPVVFNLPFGHNEPMCVLPYGAMAELDCDAGRLCILDAGVV